MSLTLKTKITGNSAFHVSSVLGNSSKNSLSQESALWHSRKKFSNAKTAKSTALDKELDDAIEKQRISSDSL